MAEEDAVIFMEEHSNNLKNRLMQAANHNKKNVQSVMKSNTVMKGVSGSDKKQRGRPIVNNEEVRTEPLHS